MLAIDPSINQPLVFLAAVSGNLAWIIHEQAPKSRNH